jgi:hypothetical protein
MKQLQRNVIGHGPTVLDRRRLLGTLGLVGLGLASGTTLTARAQTKADNKPPAKIDVSPPPADVNDLSMEVNALRTMYLLKASPDQAPELPDRNQFNGVMMAAQSLGQANPKPTAQPPRQRKQAKVSKNYLKVMTELRAAFIVNQERRINELSAQLEELIKDEQPELDDAVEITDQARKNAEFVVSYFDANRIVAYLAAYGKEFPDPYFLVLKAIGAEAKSTKPAPEEWKEIRAFVIQEVSWQAGGLDLQKQQKIGEQLASFLDMAYTLSAEELKKGGRPGAPLKLQMLKIVNMFGGGKSLDVIRNVLLQDSAELLSNPRLLPARAARKQYLGVIGRWSAGPEETSIWTPK